MNTTSTNDAYRFNHVTMKVMLDDMRFSKNALKPGQYIPNVDVYHLDGSIVGLHELNKGKPLMLVTVSLTCPMTTSSLPALQAKLGDDVNLVLVYVREAHPGEKVPQPLTIEEKIEHAAMFKSLYNLEAPIIIDDIDGQLHHSLDVLPNSVHVIDQKGQILFQSIWLTDFNFVEKAINEIKAGTLVSNSISQKMIKPLMGAIGFMHKTFSLAGPRAYKEMLFAAPPMYFMSKFAALLSFVKEKNRGKWTIMSFGVAAAVALNYLPYKFR